MAIPASRMTLPITVNLPYWYDNYRFTNHSLADADGPSHADDPEVSSAATLATATVASTTTDGSTTSAMIARPPATSGLR
jgi:hypothetical protein